jgi:hypothetical protein
VSAEPPDAVRIQAPDARVAEPLADSLRHLGAVVVATDGGAVEISVASVLLASDLHCVLRATQRWLAQQRLPGTRLLVDGRSLYVAAT